MEAATERDLLDFKNRPLTRSVRQGRLQDTLPAQPAMPVADFVKPNPLDSDVIMDATARLLAPRRMAAPREERREPERRQKRHGNRQEAEKAASPGERGRQSGGERSASAGGKTGASPRPERTGRGRDSGERFSQGAPRPTVPQPAPAGRKKRHRGHRSGAGQIAPGAVQMNTSGEQRSIMRPYYISHDD